MGVISTMHQLLMHLKKEWSLLVLNLLQENDGNNLTNKNECKTKAFAGKIVSDAFRNSSATE
jgi:hypothetical protein